MPDKRDIHQAKSKGRHKPGRQSGTGKAGSRRGGAIVTGPETTAASVVGVDRPMTQGSASVAGGGRDRKRNGRG